MEINSSFESSEKKYENYNFKYFPDYAKYISNEKFESFAHNFLQLTERTEIPLRSFIGQSIVDEFLKSFSQESKKIINYIEENRVGEFFDYISEKCQQNPLLISQVNNISNKDILLIGFLSKNLFYSFLKEYTSDNDIILNIIEEIDFFTFKLQELCNKIIIDLEQRRRYTTMPTDVLKDNLHGIIYIFSLKERKELYATSQREDLLGYKDIDVERMGSSFLQEIVHPDDYDKLDTALSRFETLSDNEILINEYRLKHKEGYYIPMRSHESILKRGIDGKPTEIIGISIDVRKENQLEDELLFLKNQLLESQEVAMVGSFDWNLITGNSTNSPQLMKILGLKDEILDPDNFYKYVHASDIDKLKNALNSAIHNGTNYECEYRFCNNDYKVLWSRGKLVYKDGEPVRLIGTVTDVTHRYGHNSHLERIEEMYDQLQLLAKIGTWSWYVSDNIIICSDEMYRIIGLLPQSELMTFDRFLEFIHPEDREKRIKTLEAVKYNGKEMDSVIRVIDNHGDLKFLKITDSAILDEHQKTIKLSGVAQDITLQYLLDEKLKQSEEELRILLNNAPDAVVAIDDDSKITFWNPKAEKLFGWSEEEALGLTLMETIMPPVHKDAHIKGMHRMHITGEHIMLGKNLKTTAIKKSGVEFDIALSISIHENGNKGFIAFIRDISEEKQAGAELINSKEELIQKNKELEARNEQLSSFSYVASHDMQEPLRKIRIYTSRLIEKNYDTLSDDTKDFVYRIMNSAEHMQLLIDDLLAFSHTMESALVFEKINLSTLLFDVKHALKYSLEEKNIKLEIGIMPTLMIIPFQFSQLLQNMLSNAIKYSNTSVQSFIKISATVVNGSEISHASANANMRYHEIVIQDNGIGFDQQYAERIFILFQRLHGKGVFRGTGIGLSICKKVAENHKGFIVAKGELGVGATFLIYIPV